MFFPPVTNKKFFLFVSHFETVCVRSGEKNPTKLKDFPEERFVGETEQVTGYCQELFCLHSSVNELLGLSGIFFILSFVYVPSF